MWIDVILTPNSRPACGGPQMIRYSASGVFLAIAQKASKVRFIDLMHEETAESSYISEDNIADVCCYAVFFGNKGTAFRHMEQIRRSRKSPRLIVVFGPFASEFPQEILSMGLADVVVSADPEFVIPLIVQQVKEDQSLSAIPNIYYRQEGKVVYTRKHSFPELDKIPFVSTFLHSNGHCPIIMTARGCQYHCVFCDRNTLWGGGIRNRSVENVLSEIRELVSDDQVREIRFLDEDLAADRLRLAKLCDGIRQIKGDFKWECSACVDSVSKELLLLMGLSRCRQIYFGVESASSSVLRKIGKRYGSKEILNAVRWAKEAGLKVEIMLTIGNPGETDHDRELTLSMLNELGGEVHVITNRLVILPGTALYRKGLREEWFTRQSFFEDEGLVFYNEQGALSENK